MPLRKCAIRQDPRQADRDGPRDPSRREALKKLAALGALAAVDIAALASCGRRGLAPLSTERKVIILGLDGLDPRFVERWMAEGKLPNMARLRDLGGYRRMVSTVPPQSPVAWATCITGRNPGGHGIFDFIQRDPQTYLPYLSIARTDAPGRTLSVGDWKLPLSGAKVQCLREGRTFWELLSERGVPCSVYRIPSDFPPTQCGAKELAGLGAPDLRGTYGEFSYYTDVPPKGSRSISGGAVYRVVVSDGHVRARLIGPANTLREGSPDTSADFDVWVDPQHRVAKIALQGQEVLLRQGEWSDWLSVRFEMMPHVRSAAGICRFYLKEVSPHFKIYVTPINVDPADPALPIAAPDGFGRELSDRFGRFYTMGFPEDVKALRHGILDDGEYLQQSQITVTEARRMYESALNALRRGVLFYYFSATDRTQHMFWRSMDPKHPAHDPVSARDYGSAIEDCYRQADGFVGQAMDAAGRDTTLVVMSDHGFAPFYRAFNLNKWLADNGYLVGKGPWRDTADILSNADWPETTAYALGFNSLYLNMRGREADGGVDPMARDSALRRLAQQLQQARDPETGDRMIARVYLGDEVYSGGLPDRAPDLVVGYAHGYRCSDESVLGEVSAHLVQDNKDKWSGDHCVDRALVPGVLFASKPIRAQVPSLPDIAASAHEAFSVAAPDEMEGKSIW